MLENWLEDCRYLVENEEWGVLTLTFHPQVIGRGHRMRMLERLIVELKAMGVVFARIELGRAGVGRAQSVYRRVNRV